MGYYIEIHSQDVVSKAQRILTTMLQFGLQRVRKHPVKEQHFFSFVDGQVYSDPNLSCLSQLAAQCQETTLPEFNVFCKMEGNVQALTPVFELHYKKGVSSSMRANSLIQHLTTISLVSKTQRPITEAERCMNDQVVGTVLPSR